MKKQEIVGFIEETKKRGSILGLTSIRALMEELGNVQEELKIIHVAGTNGKGSVCAMLASVLTSCGYRVGKYSSPSVFEEYEICQIDGKNITEEKWCAVMTKVKAAYDRLGEKKQIYPTSFEVETAAAFLYFYQEKCEYCIVETGMGGETDATNLIQRPVLSVLTSISMDHMAFLGDSLAEIAKVKAGIIKPGCPVVSAVQKPEAAEVILETAKEKQSKRYLAEPIKVHTLTADGIRFSYLWNGGWQEGETNLTGNCQVDNIACVCKILEVLKEQTDFKERLTADKIAEGFKVVVHPGRFQTVCNNPRVILDGAHNEDAARKLAQTLKSCFGSRRLLMIMGVLADKEYDKILDHLLPFAREVFVITPDNPRALSKEALAKEIQKRGGTVKLCADPKDAVQKSVKSAQEGEPILVVGSLYYLKQLRDSVSETIKMHKKQ